MTLVYNVVQKPDEAAPRLIEGYASFDISNLEIEFDKSTIRHDVLVPMLTKMFKIQIKQQIEHNVEKNLVGFMKKVGELISKAIGQTNRPFVSGFDAARNLVKASQLAEVYKKRKEKLE